MTVIRMNSCNSRTTVRVDTHRVIAFKGCGGGCNQGREACDCELSNTIPLREELPKVNYRNSSAWTGIAPRTVEQRWPSAPISYSPTWYERLLSWFTGMPK